MPKPAVMFRDSDAPDAMYAIVIVEPGAGVHFEWRDSTGAMFDGLRRRRRCPRVAQADAERQRLQRVTIAWTA